MMWLWRGLKKGVITTDFPKKEDESIPKSLYPIDIEKCPLCTDYFSCFNCGLCGEMTERDDFCELKRELPFKKSVHIFSIDVGSCSACNREIALLTAPQYDIHRLGFFFTPTPKHADILLVLGLPTKEMIPILKEAYELMPSPKYVISTGGCANGVLGNAVSNYIPVDARISGCPPQPISVLRLLLKITGRWEK